MVIEAPPEATQLVLCNSALEAREYATKTLSRYLEDLFQFSSSKGGIYLETFSKLLSDFNILTEALNASNFGIKSVEEELKDFNAMDFADVVSILEANLGENYFEFNNEFEDDSIFYNSIHSFKQFLSSEFVSESILEEDVEVDAFTEMELYRIAHKVSSNLSIVLDELSKIEDNLYEEYLRISSSLEEIKPNTYTGRSPKKKLESMVKKVVFYEYKLLLAETLIERKLTQIYEEIDGFENRDTIFEFIEYAKINFMGPYNQEMLEALEDTITEYILRRTIEKLRGQH